jgi:hypothetical protein
MSAMKLSTIPEDSSPEPSFPVEAFRQAVAQQQGDKIVEIFREVWSSEEGTSFLKICKEGPSNPSDIWAYRVQQIQIRCSRVRKANDEAEKIVARWLRSEEVVFRVQDKDWRDRLFELEGCFQSVFDPIAQQSIEKFRTNLSTLSQLSYSFYQATLNYQSAEIRVEIFRKDWAQQDQQKGATGEEWRSRIKLLGQHFQSVTNLEALQTISRLREEWRQEDQPAPCIAPAAEQKIYLMDRYFQAMARCISSEKLFVSIYSLFNEEFAKEKHPAIRHAWICYNDYLIMEAATKICSLMQTYETDDYPKVRSAFKVFESIKENSKEQIERVESAKKGFLDRAYGKIREFLQSQVPFDDPAFYSWMRVYFYLNPNAMETLNILQTDFRDFILKEGEKVGSLAIENLNAPLFRLIWSLLFHVKDSQTIRASLTKQAKGKSKSLPKDAPGYREIIKIHQVISNPQFLVAK